MADGDGVVCPVCSREYELPRRFLVRADDIEFLPVPRKLGCLHTCKNTIMPCVVCC
jgi:hypothetical protein